MPARRAPRAGEARAPRRGGLSLTYAAPASRDRLLTQHAWVRRRRAQSEPLLSSPAEPRAGQAGASSSSAHVQSCGGRCCCSALRARCAARTGSGAGAAGGGRREGEAAAARTAQAPRQRPDLQREHAAVHGVVDEDDALRRRQPPECRAGRARHGPLQRPEAAHMHQRHVPHQHELRAAPRAVTRARPRRPRAPGRSRHARARSARHVRGSRCTQSALELLFGCRCRMRGAWHLRLPRAHRRRGLGGRAAHRRASGSQVASA